MNRLGAFDADKLLVQSVVKVRESVWVEPHLVQDGRVQVADVEAVVDGGAADLGGPRQRCVLARLIAEHGRVVSADRLIADARRIGPEELQRTIEELAELELASRGGGSGGAGEDTAALLAIRRVAG